MKTKNINENILKIVAIYGTSKLFNKLKNMNDINKIIPDNVVFHRLNGTLITLEYLERLNHLDKNDIIKNINQELIKKLLDFELDGILIKFDICDILDNINNERFVNYL